MEKWFFINISGVNISDGYPDFYFGSLNDNCYYFKQKFPTELELDDILFDKIGALLLMERIPDYNLVFIVSKPLKNILKSIKEKERSLTPFLAYLNERIDELRNFLGNKKASFKFVFELDEFVGIDHIGAHGSEYEAGHWLDHQPAGTDAYKIGESWPNSLKEKLKQTPSRNSNLQYFARTEHIYFYRISLYRKNYEDYLHYLFSFLQLFVTDGSQMKETILANNSLNELEFEGNDISTYFSSFCKQVNNSLDSFKSKVKQLDAEARMVYSDTRELNIKNELDITIKRLTPVSYDVDDLNCQNVRKRADNWIATFNDFSKGLPRVLYDFNGFLNSKGNLIEVNRKSENGPLKFWKGQKIDYQEKHNALSRQIKASPFNEQTFIRNWKKNIGEKFVEIKKETQRCPNQTFMLFTLIFSLFFFLLPISILALNVESFNDYILFFAISTFLYLGLNLYLYFKYKKASINKIKEMLGEIDKYNRKQLKYCKKQLKLKTDNQIRIYELGVLNQNISFVDKSILFFEEQSEKIKAIRRNNENINNIAHLNKVDKDFNLTKEVEQIPNSISSYIKTFDTQIPEVPIKLYKNKNDQNQEIKKFKNRNNALKAIKLTQK